MYTYIYKYMYMYIYIHLSTNIYIDINIYMYKLRLFGWKYGSFPHFFQTCAVHVLYLRTSLCIYVYDTMRLRYII